MEPGTTNHSARRIAAFTAGLGLSLLYFIISDNQWPSNSEFHTIMEMSATVLALFIGILALVNYYSKKEGTILFIGTGFLGTAFFRWVSWHCYFGILYPLYAVGKYVSHSLELVSLTLVLINIFISKFPRMEKRKKICLSKTFQ
ncbi:MAG: hypothetical protein P8O77_05940 [Emcibacteraceae bacterium]|nr:hypothetical protein [Emcibacteraceae bacterium]